jgi:hypothetical protein
MDAKTRHRQRLKLQAALTRTLDVLFANVDKQIKPDRTTAKMAVVVIKNLFTFVSLAGEKLGTDYDLGDLERFRHLNASRLKESAARRRRSQSHR